MKNIGLSENPGLSACAGQFYQRAKLIFKTTTYTQESISMFVTHHERYAQSTPGGAFQVSFILADRATPLFYGCPCQSCYYQLN